MIRAKLEDWEIERKSRPFDVPKHDEKQIHFAITFIPMSNSPASHGLYEHSFSSTHCEKDFKGFLEMNHTVSNWFEKNFSEARFVVSPIGHRVEYSKNQHGYEMDGVLISTDNPNAAVMAKMQFGGAQ
ncbi:MAG: hypothetical protein ABS78_22085 [Phenylobacterium sp. SCN 70-31]|nr:MAG: hypothetical protein ABS78_22085 [Phenylobacterium sp. SCN 70-31]